MKRETYRAACDQAKEELRDILAEIDLLRSRKDQIEKMIAVLEPLSGPEGIAAQIDRALDRRIEVSPTQEFREYSRPRGEEIRYQEEQPTAVPVSMMATERAEQMVQEVAHEHVAAPTVEDVVAAGQPAEEEPVLQGEEVSSDPIKRRIANALRHRVVMRDSQEFNKAFSGGITRW